jgi:hypothetical protein
LEKNIISEKKFEQARRAEKDPIQKMPKWEPGKATKTFVLK